MSRERTVYPICKIIIYNLTVSLLLFTLPDDTIGFQQASFQ